MYEVSDVLPTGPLDAGTHVLGSSPPMLGMRGVAYRFLAHGLDASEGCVVVTTETDAPTVADAVAGHATADLDDLGIVDATGWESDPDSVPYRVEPVGSPSDLTGIGIGLTKLLEALHAAGTEGYRVVVDSLSSLLVYTGFGRLYRLMHTITNRIDRIGGVSLSLLNASTDREQIAKLESLFDGVVELRETETETAECRVRGLGGEGAWLPFEPDDSLRPDRSEPQGGAASSGSARTAREPAGPAFESPTSLRGMIEAVDAAGYTLTLCNYSGDEGMLAELRDYFGRLNVDVRSTELGTEEPANVALLHRGPDVIATSPVADLRNAIRLEAIETDGDLTAVVEPDVFEHVHRKEYTVQNGGKLQMVRIGRLIETRALERGAGTLHTGFQRLDRVQDELGTRDLYEGLAGTDVDIHLYGEPGAVPNAEQYTLHTAPDGELAEAWFVVYDGAGEDARKAALATRETEPERYTGFWTYQPAIVDSIASYLERRYAGG